MRIHCWLTDCWDGPRHDLAKQYWEKAAGMLGVTTCVFHNKDPIVHHWLALKEIWRQEVMTPQRYAIITEFDFLPDLEGGFFPYWLFDDAHPIIACEYCRRDGGIGEELVRCGIPCAYYLAIDKYQISHLDFVVSGEYNDPCNGLQDYLDKFYPGKQVRLIAPSEDCLPHNYGIRFPMGHHIQWMRHWNDPPEMKVGHFSIGKINEGVDRALADYGEYLNRISREGTQAARIPATIGPRASEDNT